MSESTNKFIDALAKGDNVAAGDAFKDALRDKVADSLDAKRQELAGHIFNQKPEVNDGATEFSDPKPNVADPAPETGQVIDTQGNQIEFTPNNAEPESQDK